MLQTVKKAWNDFLRYYNERAKKYTEEAKLRGEEARKEHWICWNESDLMMHLSRFIYRHLEEERIRKVEIHLDKNLSLNNFRKYNFKDKLNKLKNMINVERAPKIDLIIAKEADFNIPFLLCGEAKCFHASIENVSGKRRTLERDLDRDIKELKAIKELYIAKEVVLIIFDDYYYLFDEEKSQMIEEKRKEAKKQGIKVLYSKSEAKLGRE